MSEEKKPTRDLTGILQFSQALGQSGQAPPLPEGAVLEENPIEKINEFESLDQYAENNPLAEPAASENFFPETPHESQFETHPSPGFENGNNFLASPDSHPPEETSSPPAPQDPSLDFEKSPFDKSHDTTSPPAPVPPLPSPSEKDPIETIRNYSDRIQVAQPSIPAAFPFSLLITGKLRPEEKEKLIEILNREEMGVREIELEPQLDCGTILIPRISEYAGILLVQALRGAQVEMRLGPSDQIFATEETRSDAIEEISSPLTQTSAMDSDLSHPAEKIPLTSETQIPGFGKMLIVDTIMATATLKSNAVEAESTSEYPEILEALQRELKYKTYRRGGTAILNFKIQLNTLALPSLYRVLALGTAIKPAPKEEASEAFLPLPKT